MQETLKLLLVPILGAAAIFTSAAGSVQPIIPAVAHPLPLSDVRLTGGPLKNAQDLDAKYLLELKPDRMLANFRIRAGMEAKAPSYGGWDGGGRNLTGHILGHYLSAVSYMYAATGNPEFKQRADYIVNELKEIQDHEGDGYLGAQMGNVGTGRRGGGGAGGSNSSAGGGAGTNNAGGTGGGGGRRGGANSVVDGRILYQQLTQGNIRSGGFDLNGMWSPWYVEHKIFAGLRDAYRFTGNRTALKVEIKFAGWVDSIVSKLTDAQDQQMLATEFGGINETLVDLYADTGDARWLKTAACFEHRSYVDPLARHEDILGGTHANTAMPKMLGELERYLYTADTWDGNAADYFWDDVVQHHTFATGGQGYDEYFGPADRMSDEVFRGGQRTAESCNVYNMLKFERKLFSLWPDAHYADYQERALFNHVLASIDPTAGWTCYMVPVGHGVTHEYERDMLDGGFSCCVGSGMENHALHGDGIYYESGDKQSGEKLWVNIYVPTTAEWKTMGASLKMDTTFPDGDSANFTVQMKSPREFTLALRRPYWVGQGFSVKVNGVAVSNANPSAGGFGRRGGAGGAGAGTNDSAAAGGRRGGRRTAPSLSTYVEIKRTWQSGDTVSLSLPKTLREEPLADNANRMALMWGPLVLAGDLGPEGGRGGARRNRAATNEDSDIPGVPVFVAADKPIADWLKPEADKPGWFRTDGVGHDRGTDKDLEFAPFYKLARRTYLVYCDVFSPADWKEKSSVYLAEQEKTEKLKAATVAFAQPGQMQPERDYNFQFEGENTVSTENVDGRDGRRGTKWFSFDLPVETNHPMTLVVTYSSYENAARHFYVLVDGQRVGDQTIEGSNPVTFKDVEYSVPAELLSGKEKATVRFEAATGSEIPAVFGLRMVRADAPQ